MNISYYGSGFGETITNTNATNTPEVAPQKVTTPFSAINMKVTTGMEKGEGGNPLIENGDVTEVKKGMQYTFQFWLALVAMWFIYHIVRMGKLKEGAKEGANPREILPTLHNFLLIGLAVIIFKPLANMVLTKIVMFRIPILDKAAAGLLPLVNA